MNRSVKFAVCGALLYAGWKAYVNRNMPHAEGTNRYAALAVYSVSPDITMVGVAGAAFILSKVV